MRTEFETGETSLLIDSLFVQQFLLLLSNIGTLLVVLPLFGSFLAASDGPPRFPIPLSEEAVDCDYISVLYITGDKGRIKIGLNYPQQTYQFPPEVLHSLMYIDVKYKGLYTRFDSSNFWDLSSDLSRVEFCVLNPYNGNISVCLKCQRYTMMKTNLLMKNIDAYSVGYSRFIETDKHCTTMYDVTFNNEKNIVFHSTANITFTEVKFYYDINNNITANNSRASKSGYKFINASVVAVYCSCKNSLDTYIDAILPLWITIGKSDVKNLYLRTNCTGIREILDKFGGFTYYESEEPYTFSEIMVLHSTGFSNGEASRDFDIQRYEHLERIYSDPHPFTNLRDKLLGVDKSKNKLLLDESMLKYEHYFNNLNRDLNILYYDDSMDVTLKKLHESSVFISSNISRSVFSLVLPRNGVFIDIQGDGSNFCRPYSKSFFSDLAIDYRPYNVKDDQTCTVQSNVSVNIDIGNLINEIKSIFT